ncbi:hypothetical protein AVEN_141856-1 [Araneus ventricosus]|uniref:Uncharacterized protein n=1 Tax=Araneus ventricosus TaxID=182803 RepID=A0A4Y2L4Q1_ARAVE|nr:hypothetical protein AVEN_141856-1 [Araneus ventricosus]
MGRSENARKSETIMLFLETGRQNRGLWHTKHRIPHRCPFTTRLWPAHFFKRCRPAQIRSHNEKCAVSRSHWNPFFALMTAFLFRLDGDFRFRIIDASSANPAARMPMIHFFPVEGVSCCTRVIKDEAIEKLSYGN